MHKLNPFEFYNETMANRRPIYYGETQTNSTRIGSSLLIAIGCPCWNTSQEKMAIYAYIHEHMLLENRWRNSNKPWCGDRSLWNTVPMSRTFLHWVLFLSSWHCRSTERCMMSKCFLLAMYKHTETACLLRLTSVIVISNDSH